MHGTTGRHLLIRVSPVVLLRPIETGHSGAGGELLAVYDFEEHGESLGSLLMYLHLLSMHVRDAAAARVTLLLRGQSPSLDGATLFDSLLATVNVGCPVSVWSCEAESELGTEIEGRCTWVWPPGDQDLNCASTAQHAEYHAIYGHIPALQLTAHAENAAREFLDTARFMNRQVIAVHLKNQEGQEGCSNANMGQWQAFFSEALDSSNSAFVLLGGDSVSLSFVNAERIIQSKDYDHTLGTQMAIVKAADFFMGMASGLCQVAILNSKPYAVFKNPGHHREAMKDERIRENRLPFAGEHQRFLIEWDCEASLLREFRRMMGLVVKSPTRNHLAES